MRPNESDFVAWNDEMVRKYDPDAYHTRSPLPIRLLESMRVHKVLQLLDAADRDRVLEIGCGAGNLLERARGRRVGLDLSGALLEKARGRLGPRVGLVRGDALRLPFANASFDRIFCSEVLEHVLEPARLVVEMRRVLHPTACAVVSVPNEALINRVKESIFRLSLVRAYLSSGEGRYHMSERMDDEWHLHVFSADELTALTRPHFAIDAFTGVPSRWFPLRWVVRLRPI